MKELKSILPMSTLVIGLGNFAGNLLPQVRTLCVQSDPRRSAMVGFYRAIMSDTGSRGPKLESVEGEASREPSTLDLVLHELRLHENYLRVGLGGEHNLLLEVIVLVDLTEDGSEALYPLFSALSEKLTDEPDGYVYLLCKTAIVETDPMRKQVQARLHLHLKMLEHIAGDRKFQVYLFDGLKEGMLKAKDENEIGILMQNFLLALLSGRLALTLVNEYSLVAGDLGKVFYNSAGATALVYDPTLLQEFCTKRLAAATLENEFLAGSPPAPHGIESATQGIFQEIGSVSAWVEKLSAITPYRIKPNQVFGLDLHLSDLEFEDLPPQEWGDSIAGYASHFEKNQQIRYLASLEANSASLERIVVETFAARLYALPVRSGLYPAGITASRQVLQECAQEVYDRIQTCLPIQQEEETAAILDSEYQFAIERLDEAISALPDPPRWMKRLPGRLYSYAKMLFEFFLLRREYGQLIVLRELIIHALENKLIFQFEQALRRRLIDLCKQLLSSLEKTQSDLDALHAKFLNLKSQLAKKNSFAPQGSSPFRANLVTPALLEWVYGLKDKDSAGIRAELLEMGYLDDWQNLTEEDVYRHLLQACQDTFQFVHEFEAEEILKRIEFDDFSHTLLSLSQGAVPALRPDFDRTGETSSYSSSYFLCTDPRESEIGDILRSSARTWQGIPTGDPYLILFCRVRQMIPLNALAFLTQSAKAAFENLTEEEQGELLEMFEGMQS